jgi:Uma2 family endonuclease
MTFEEYLFYHDESDAHFELVKGQLVPMPTVTGLHTAICEFLAASLQRYIASKGLPLVARSAVGVRTQIDSSRIPDLLVCGHEFWNAVVARRGAGVFNFGETPRLVVEVVSDDRKRDYVEKRSEYGVLGILEYWIVDPAESRVWMMSEPRGESGYQKQVEFTREQNLVSRLFPDLVLPVADILSPTPTEEILRNEQQQLMQERERAEQERVRAEQERERAEQERERAEQERQMREVAEQEREAQRLRAEQLEAYLRKLNLDPDSLP